MTTEWRIYCETESSWVYEWNDTVITTCPTDIGHTVNNDSIQE